MPTTGLFRIIRQPIYVSFALTLWTVPVWTPDQLALAMALTAYCLLAPKLKENRFEKRYGMRFRAYRYIDWADKDVLDLGCAGGFMAEALASKGARVTGIDPASDAIEAAKSRATLVGQAIR